jgi:hypothetical protein
MVARPTRFVQFEGNITPAIVVVGTIANLANGDHLGKSALGTVWPSANLISYGWPLIDEPVPQQTMKSSAVRTRLPAARSFRRM